MFRNILYLNDGGRPNYGPDSIFIGLKNSGYCVEDRPRKPSFHSTQPPKISGKLVGLEVTGYYGRNEVDSVDLVLADVRSNIKQIPKGPPLAVLDGEDDDEVREPFYQLANVYFKREFTPKWKDRRKACPLPFGLVQKRSTPGRSIFEREIDVSFTAKLHDSVPERRKVFDVLQKIKNRNPQMEIVDGFYLFESFDQNWERYKAILEDSKISISVRGAGWDTYRYWEIVHRGAVLCSQRLPIEIPHNFEDEAIWYDMSNLSALEKILKEHLSDPEHLEKMRGAAWARLIQFHIAEERAGLVLERMRRCLGA